jgi:hypothetical protein
MDITDKKDRKKIAQVFKEAKKHLWDGNEGSAGRVCICFAIDTAVTDCYSSRSAIRIVMNRLSGEPTVRRYLSILAERGIVKPEHLTDENIQMFRHRWLDALIKEFSE